MSTICNPLCGESEIRTYCTPCDRIQATRKGAINQLILFDCETAFEDITDAEEWAAKIAAGEVTLIPEGVGELVEPEQTTERISACRSEEVNSEISGLNYQLKLFDNVTYTDFDLEFDLKNKIAAKTLAFIDCNGLLYIDYTYTSGDNPGFSDLTSNVFRNFPTDGLQFLQINIRFNSFRTGYRGVPLTPAIQAVISTACVETSS